MPITWNDFDKIWAVSSPLTPYTFSDLNYAAGWNFIGSTPPARQMWDSLQKANDEKFKFLRDNFGTPNMVTTAAQMTDTDKIYVYVGSEAGWSNGHWYYYDAGTSTWVDGGVYNSTALVTDTTLTVAGKAADAKAVGDALALKADLAGATFSGNVAVNADFSTTGDATVGGDLTVSGVTTLTGNVTANGNISVVGDIDADNITLNGDIDATDVTASGDVAAGTLSVSGATTLTGNVTAGANITASGDVTANDASFANATLSGTLTVSGATTLDGLTVGSVSAQSLNTTGNASVGGTLTVSGATTLADITAGDITADDVAANGNLSVVGNATLNGTSTAVTPAEDDNSTNIATTAYVQTEIKPIETDVTINDKRISNIEKLLQGNLYDYQTDTDSAYTKTVLSGAMPYASLDSIGGKTLVWNQLNDNSGTTGNAGGIDFTNNGDGSWTINGTATSSFSKIFGYNDFVNGHKYYIKGCPSGGSASTYSFGVAGGKEDIGSGGMLTATATGHYNLRFNFASGTTFNNVKVYPQLTDLTLCYGSGNEPTTVAEFTAQFPAQYYAFNQGSLLSADVTSVVSVGKNIWDEQWESGAISITTGATYPNSATIRSANYIPCQPSTTYTNVGYTLSVFQYDIDNNYISYATTPTGTFTTSANTYFLKFYRTATAYNNDISINKGNDSAYHPYMSATYPIPAEIQALEGYGWSAGSVYNYIDYERKVFVKRVGKLHYDGTGWVLRNTQDNGMKTYSRQETSVTDFSAGYISNVVKGKVTAYVVGYIGEVTWMYDLGACMAVLSGGNYVYLNTTDISNTDLNIYYVLATPVEVDISAYLTDDNLISVEAGGTLTFENQNGDDYRIPVPSSETYMVDLQSALGE